MLLFFIFVLHVFSDPIHEKECKYFYRQFEMSHPKASGLTPAQKEKVVQKCAQAKSEHENQCHSDIISKAGTAETAKKKFSAEMLACVHGAAQSGQEAMIKATNRLLGKP